MQMLNLSGQNQHEDRRQRCEVTSSNMVVLLQVTFEIFEPENAVVAPIISKKSSK
jgi:hypothetical protein